MTHETSFQPQNDDEGQGTAAIGLCRTAHQRLFAVLARLDDEMARRPSPLPGWSVGHVLTHLARNADGHLRRLEGALRGEDVPRYPGGKAQRDGEIEAGASRGAVELAADVMASAGRLEEAWSQSSAAGWPNQHLLADDHWPTTESPWRRLREVEVHHVDLGLGYQPIDWPEEYVRWELPLVLARLPERLPGSDDSSRLLAWLIGRAEQAPRIALDPW